ncbi:MAG: valine--tRNA ligase [Clostridia bacterium]|nr:valine--tRNA ligase [Clostridia bacterium]
MEKTYQPQKFESKIYQTWLEKKYFAARPDKNKKKFSVCMPPPNVTGKAHVGHALNNTIQDIVVRYKRMNGFETLWTPGTDHAAIATEAKVVNALEAEGLSKAAIGREKFIERGWQWYKLYGDTICDQLKMIGISCDWDKKAFTMDENLNKAVKHSFVEYYKKGYIYKGKRVINYCPHCKSSISDIENEYKEQTTKLWHIRYPYEDGSGAIVVATTRPETMFGDTAVAVNPNDKRYKSIIGKNVILPIVNKPIPVIADDYCEMDFGTGAVKITPAHDPNDYDMGLRHNLPIVTVIDDEGKLNENACQFVGMDRIEARKPIEEELKKLGVLVKTETYKNKVGCCCRCGTMTEPRVSEQWWVKMKELAEPAIEAVRTGKLKFIPKRYEKMYLNWLCNIQDWCISRQLWLGHRIPVFTCPECGHVDAYEEENPVCPKCGCNHMEQEADVLDTWFSSALWPFSTLGWPNTENNDLYDYFYPTDVLITAYDIITFWVVRMVFSGLFFTKQLPFKEVVINGIVRDIQGRKMSKNLGNGIDPIDVINEHGADSLRLSLVNGTQMGQDIGYCVEKAKDSKIFINKLYNASKFVILNTENINIKPLSSFKLDEKDKWVLSKLQALVKSTAKNIDKYALGVASANLIDFTVGVFCDWYIEVSKIDLYGDNAENKEKTQNILLYVLNTLLKLFHPYIPFVTEEIYQNLPGHGETIMLEAYPQVDDKLTFKDLKFENIINVVKAIRATRSEYNIPDNKKISINILANEEEKLFASSLEVIAKLAGGNQVQLVKAEPAEKSAKIVTSLCNIYLPMGDLVDEAQETERIEKKIEELKFEIARSEKMLSNAGFVAKAPAALVEAEKEKLAKNKEFLAQLLGK